MSTARLGRADAARCSCICEARGATAGPVDTEGQAGAGPPEGGARRRPSRSLGLEMKGGGAAKPAAEPCSGLPSCRCTSAARLAPAWGVPSRLRVGSSRKQPGTLLQQATSRQKPTRGACQREVVAVLSQSRAHGCGRWPRLCIHRSRPAMGRRLPGGHTVSSWLGCRAAACLGPRTRRRRSRRLLQLHPLCLRQRSLQLAAELPSYRRWHAAVVGSLVI